MSVKLQLVGFHPGLGGIFFSENQVSPLLVISIYRLKDFAITKLPLYYICEHELTNTNM